MEANPDQALCLINIYGLNKPHTQSEAMICLYSPSTPVPIKPKHCPLARKLLSWGETQNIRGTWAHPRLSSSLACSFGLWTGRWCLYSYWNSESFTSRGLRCFYFCSSPTPPRKRAIVIQGEKNACMNFWETQKVPFQMTVSIVCDLSNLGVHPACKIIKLGWDKPAKICSNC